MPLKRIFPFIFLLLLVVVFLGITAKKSSAQQVPDIEFFVNQVLIGVNQAHAANMQPIVRVGVHGAAGFEDPAQLVAFATALNGRVSAPVWLIAGPNEPETELWASPGCADGNGACVGPPVAAYMNTIISNAGGLSNIRLLSPAFNLCSPVFPSLISAMGSANWGGLDGIAVNVYNGTPVGPAEDNINDCLNSRLPLIPSDLPVIITETGAYDGNIQALANEIAALPGRVSGALLFNGLNTNPGWSRYALSDDQINTVCGGNCRDSGVGVNFATVYTNGNYGRAASLNMGWTLEILGEGGGYGVAPTMLRLQIPCNATTNPEHDYTRPYPFNPCDPFIPQRNTMTFQCGTGVETTGNFEFPQVPTTDLPPSDLDPDNVLQNTPPYGDDTSSRSNLFVCAGTRGNTIPTICAIKRVPFDIEIDLSRVDLPVMGNTQVNYPPDVQANAYLSGYLTGITTETAVSGGAAGTANLSDPFLTFSGPVKKIFSQLTQRQIRLTIRNAIDNTDIHNYLVRGNTRIRSAANNPLSEIFSRIPLSSMEDVVGETIVEVIPTTDAQPTLQGGRLILNQQQPNSTNALRLRISRTNSTPDVNSDGRLYLAHLRETLWLSDLLQNYALPQDPLFGDPRVQPVDPTNVTRVAGAPDKNAHQGTQDNTIVQLTYESAAYGETPTRNTEIIDNPVDQRGVGRPATGVVQNGQYLSESEISGGRDTLRNFLGPYLTREGNTYTQSANPAGYANYTAICSLGGITYPTGDAAVDQNGWQIRARLTYTQVFQYPALPPPNCNSCNTRPTGGQLECGSLPCGTGYRCAAEIDQTACNQCRATAPPEVCESICNPQFGQCIADDTITLPTGGRVALFTKTPFAGEIYKSLVAGDQSVMRRFLPYPDQTLLATNSCPSGEYLKGEAVLRTGNDPISQDLDRSCVRSAGTPVEFSGSAGVATAAHPSVPDGGRTTTQAGYLYMPYVGSIYDYFLGCGGEPLNFQRLLRPQGITGSCSASTGSPTVPPRRFVAIVLGQSNAASFGQSDSSLVINPSVRCLSGGSIAPASEPLCGTDGTGSSPWTRLGNLLMNSGLYSEVVFIPAAVGSTRVADWAPGGSQHSRLQATIASARSQGLTVTHILWHQGESDSWPEPGTSQTAYQNSLQSIIETFRSQGINAPFYVARATRCDPTYPQSNPNIITAQSAVINASRNVLAGPNTDTLKSVSSNRSPGDECHFSIQGLQAHAQAWFSAIQSTTSLAPLPPTGGLCVIPTVGFCSLNDPITQLQSTINGQPVSASIAALVCKRESGGNPAALNTNCLKAVGAGYTRDYSVGLFQFNLLAHPNRQWLNSAPEAASLRQQLNSAGFTGQTCSDFIQDNYVSEGNPNNSCNILNQNALNICVNWFSQPQNSVAYLDYLSANGTNWQPWRTNNSNQDVLTCFR